MDDLKRKIIVSEIENWRKNNLLPEHYCIFLLNLYTEGEQAKPVSKSAGGSRESKGFFGSSSSGSTSNAFVKEDSTPGYHTSHGGESMRQSASVSWKMVWYWLLGAVGIATVILLAFHFNGFSTLMQIAISSIFILITYILAFVFKKRTPIFTHISLLISFLLLIFAGMYFIKEFGLPTSTVLVFMAFICLLWCINGFIFGFSYLLYCGILGFGLLYGIITVNRLEADYSWWLAELYWVPLSILMIGLGFLFHERNRQLASVLAICGIVYLYGSEISSLYVADEKRDIIQLLLFIKVFLNSVFLFLTRSYWFQWLRL